MISYPRLVFKSHPLIATVLAQDEERGKEFGKYNLPWLAPRYDSAIKKRQLRILNAIFLSTQQHGCRPSMSTSKYVEEHGDATIQVGGQVVTLKLKRIVDKKRGADIRKSVKERLSISILAKIDNSDVQQYWEDTETTPIEDALPNIVVAIIISGELQYRHSVQSQYEWRIQRRAELEEEARQKKIEAERMAQEQREKRERKRVERLLAAATALQQAETIRSFVATIRARSSEMCTPTEKVERWATWALAQANRIDPAKALAFLEDIED